jgi:hypothetical protein
MKDMRKDLLMSDELKYTPADFYEAYKAAFEKGYHEGNRDFIASDELKYAQADLDEARKIAFDKGYEDGYEGRRMLWPPKSVAIRR